MIVKPHPGGDPAARAHRPRSRREVLRGGGLRSERRCCSPPTSRARRSPRSSRSTRRSAIIDFTGSPAFGALAAGERRQASSVYTEEAGVNSDRDRLDRRLQGHVPEHRLLAVALFRPDVHGPAEHLRARRTASKRTRAASPSTRSRQGIAAAVDGLLGDPHRAAGDPRRHASRGDARPHRGRPAARPGRARFALPLHPAAARTPHRNARSSSPSTPPTRRPTREERFGPISFVVADADARRSRSRGRLRSAKAKGAITARALRHRRGRSSMRPRRPSPRPACPLGQPDRRHLRQPVRRLQRLPRHRGEPGRERLPDRYGLRRQPLPDRHRTQAACGLRPFKVQLPAPREGRK